MKTCFESCQWPSSWRIFHCAQGARRHGHGVRSDDDSSRRGQRREGIQNEVEQTAPEFKVRFGCASQALSLSARNDEGPNKRCSIRVPLAHVPLFQSARYSLEFSLVI